MTLQFSLTFESQINVMLLFVTQLFKLFTYDFLSFPLPLLPDVFPQRNNSSIPSILFICPINLICLFLMVLMSDRLTPTAANRSVFVYLSVHDIAIQSIRCRTEWCRRSFPSTNSLSLVLLISSFDDSIPCHDDSSSSSFSLCLSLSQFPLDFTGGH